MSFVGEKLREMANTFQAEGARVCGHVVGPGLAPNATGRGGYDDADDEKKRETRLATLKQIQSNLVRGHPLLWSMLSLAGQLRRIFFFFGYILISFLFFSLFRSQRAAKICTGGNGTP